MRKLIKKLFDSTSVLLYWVSTFITAFVTSAVLLALAPLVLTPQVSTFDDWLIYLRSEHYFSLVFMFALLWVAVNLILNGSSKPYKRVHADSGLYITPEDMRDHMDTFGTGTKRH